MSIEIGGVPTGAETILELFETQADIIYTSAWESKGAGAMQITEPEATSLYVGKKVCGKCIHCDVNYLYT